ncbi:hypothetical protein [Phenylobacterium sp.]|uniref:hypothetical protein n=1 Tax=Phenylobacterium sp. TaxID=1871053 RepID=UPI0035B4C813
MFADAALPLWLGVILICAYALADRFVGGGWPKLDDALPGRSVFWAALALIALGWAAGGVLGAVLGLIWAVQRSLDSNLFGASIDPPPSRAAATFVRHSLAALAAIPLALWLRRPIGELVGPFLSYAAVASILARLYAMRVKRGDEGFNTYVELARGAAFGVAVCWVIERMS